MSRTLRLPRGTAAVFGYGSLLSRASVERTLGHRYDGPFVVCTAAGWRRRWDVGMPNTSFYWEADPGARVYPEKILYLNVCRRPGSRLNGVLFVVTEDELAAFDRREWIYTRERLNDQLVDVHVTGGDAWMYVAKPEYVAPPTISPEAGAIRASYLRLLDAGLTELGARFRAQYEQSSDVAPAALVVDDRQDPNASDRTHAVSSR